jgi:hypothetical protein
MVYSRSGEVVVMRRHPGSAGTLAVTVVLALAAAACSARDGSASASRASQAGSVVRSSGARPATSQAGAGQSGSASASRADGTCPVTVANGSVPPGESPSGDVPQYHGNGALWAALPPFGVVVARPEDVAKNGDIDAKFGWWRGVQGTLTISGRRLDGVAGRLKSEVPSGYGPTGFQATGIDFPTEGCWEVTGRAGTARLTFVVIVVKADRWLLKSR